tara:strand:- start:4168 stop:4776 length:609 start_codon:yes stop_codon:yes gene_type:complete
MEVGSLFNSGILGQSFNWWMGQVMDDCSWRENINPDKFDNKFDIPGWAYRYRVRIMGLHPQSEDILETEELPWATLMYPVTAGGGQAAAFQTPAIRQGNFVFGYFMDGGQQQVPVIMGILGNNAQTPLQQKTGKTGGENFKAQSGYAESCKPKGKAQETAPESDLGVNKPKSPTQLQEEVAVNNNGGSFTLSQEVAKSLGYT